MPSIVGAKFALDLLTALPAEFGSANVSGKGQHARISLIARRSYRYAGREGRSKRVLTGGVQLIADVTNKAVHLFPQKVARLKPGWTDATFCRAVQRLTDWAITECHRQQYVENLDTAAKPLEKDEAFRTAVEAQEAVWGKSDYRRMTIAEAIA